MTLTPSNCWPVKQPHMPEIHRFVRVANQLVTDGDTLRRMGIDTVSEGNTLGGMVKAVAYGFATSVEGFAGGLSLLRKRAFRTQAVRLDAKYGPQGRVYGVRCQSAQSFGNAMAALVLCAGWGLLCYIPLSSKTVPRSS